MGKCNLHLKILKRKSNNYWKGIYKDFDSDRMPLTLSDSKKTEGLEVEFSPMCCYEIYFVIANQLIAWMNYINDN